MKRRALRYRPTTILIQLESLPLLDQTLTPHSPDTDRHPLVTDRPSPPLIGPKSLPTMRPQRVLLILWFALLATTGALKPHLEPTRRVTLQHRAAAAAAVAAASVTTGPSVAAAKELSNWGGLILADPMGVKDGRMDMSTMPDPAVPVVFSLAIIVGVGILQLSLGDVYAEEADLGISSGINAKKEMERRSKSYFKGSGGTTERFDD